jgi:predicted  nucleic acid-binding Zn-ribbon protein
MSQTLSLFRLQQTDTQLDHRQARLKAIQKILEDDEVLRRASGQAESAETERLAAERDLRQAEAIVQDQSFKIEQAEASLYGGKGRSPKELQDLQNDVAALKRHLAVLEDRQLDAMLALEKAESACKAAQSDLQAVQANWREQNRSLNQEKANLQKEVETLGAEHRAIAVAVPPGDLGQYESLRQQRGGVAVASITDNACAACGVGLTPAQVQSARSANPMAHCPSCGRILYCN